MINKIVPIIIHLSATRKSLRSSTLTRIDPFRCSARSNLHADHKPFCWASLVDFWMSECDLLLRKNKKSARH
jgi:hypothetical protein